MELELSGSKNKKNLEEKLRLLDEQSVSKDFTTLALSNLRALSLDLLLLLVFHSWKTGQLDSVRANFNKLKDEEKLDPIAEQFLFCHEIRVQGLVKESYKVLEDLARRSHSQIVQYRYVAEFLEFGNLNQAVRLMEEIMPHLPLSRRRVIEFNYGIAANNQSNFSIVEKVIADLKAGPDDLSQMFFHWLSAAYLEQEGTLVKSLAHYENALNLAQKIPSRSTDVGVIAYGALREAFWSGHLEKARKAFNIIENDAKQKKAGVGVVRFALSQAMIEFLEGNILKAARRLEVLFTEEIWTRDHLQGAFVYLWSLIATGRGKSIPQIVEKLERVAHDMSHSNDIYDFTLFRLYARFLNGDADEEKTHLEILRFCQAKSHRQQSFHLDWADGMALLFQVEPFEKLKSIAHFKLYPILQRTVVWILAHNEELNSPVYWRYVLSQTTDPTALAMGEYRLAQLGKDVGLFVKSVRQLNEKGALTWLASLDRANSGFNYELGHRVNGASFVLDYQSRRAVATSGESLDSQPQLAELFLILAEKDLPIDKEAIAIGLGYLSYDPMAHDPVIYNLLARLRDWLKKQDEAAEIHHLQRGWRLSFNDQMVKFGLIEESTNKKISVDTLVLDDATLETKNLSSNLKLRLKSDFPPDLPPRLQWILQNLSFKGVITRKDLLDNFEIQKSTAASDFNTLISRKFIKRYGSGRGIFYKMKELS